MAEGNEKDVSSTVAESTVVHTVVDSSSEESYVPPVDISAFTKEIDNAEQVLLEENQQKGYGKF